MKIDYSDEDVRELLDFLGLQYCCDCPNQNDCDSCSIKMIMNIVELQLSEEPTGDDDFYLYCPNCGGDSYNIMYDSMINAGYNYCAKCGKKLNWVNWKKDTGEDENKIIWEGNLMNKFLIDGGEK